ncbi:MAG: osmoprotectant transporter activator [Rhodocyclaceae bacterium]|nr:osmoprotectant transporter activator [Rhodocyclaceae bacterium]
MTATEAKPARSNSVLDVLNSSFAVFRDCQPLAIGIHKTIKERMPEIDAAQLRLAMRIHTTSTRYLKAQVTGKDRFDLDGAVAGEVTDEQREVASATLKERFKKAAERRRADEKAKQEALKEQQAQQKRQEKLGQLAAKFNRR